MNDITIIITAIILSTLISSIPLGLQIHFNSKHDREWQARLQSSMLELHRMRDENHREAISILKVAQKTNDDNAVFLRMIFERVESKKGFNNNEENGDYV